MKLEKLSDIAQVGGYSWLEFAGVANSTHSVYKFVGKGGAQH